jgi:3-carboxy-cis,cis-muconate cycloisomerase
LTSADAAAADAGRPGLLGLLGPVAVGTAVEAASGDGAWLQAMLDAEAALARAQARHGMVSARAASAISDAARVGDFDVWGIAVSARASGNPVIPLVADLREAVSPEAADCVHRGATSQDIMDTAAMLVAARCRTLILADLRAVALTLADLAAAHRLTPMAGRTLTQHAVPTTFGLKAAGWRSLVLDACERLASVRLPAQLGGAAGTLAALSEFGRAAAVDVSVLVEAYACELGLAAPELPWHVLRTPVADLAAALGFTAAALGKVAADVLTLSRSEIGEVAEGVGGGSSAMPHKSNPVRSTLIAAAARQAPAASAVLISALSAEDERPAGAWHSEWQPLRELLRLAGGAAEAARGLTAGLVVDPERMRRNLDLTGFVTSERLAVVLTGLVGVHEARALVGRAVARGVPFDQDPELLAVVDEERLRDLADPAGYLGAAGELVDRALARSGAVAEGPTP